MCHETKPIAKGVINNFELLNNNYVHKMRTDNLNSCKVLYENLPKKHLKLFDRRSVGLLGKITKPFSKDHAGKILDLGFSVLLHPPYLPDLALRNYSFFLLNKTFSQGDLIKKTFVEDFFSFKPAEFFFLRRSKNLRCKLRDHFGCRVKDSLATRSPCSSFKGRHIRKKRGLVRGRVLAPFQPHLTGRRREKVWLSISIILLVGRLVLPLVNP